MSIANAKDQSLGPRVQTILGSSGGPFIGPRVRSQVSYIWILPKPAPYPLAFCEPWPHGVILSEGLQADHGAPAGQLRKLAVSYLSTKRIRRLGPPIFAVYESEREWKPGRDEER